MSAASRKLALRPERCDGCGKCEGVCARGAIHTGAGYLFVDQAACDGCGKCVDVCSRGALERTSQPRRSASRAAAKGRARGDSSPTKTEPKTPRDPSGPWVLAEAAAVLAAMLALFVAEEVVLASAWLYDLPSSAGAVARLFVLGAYYAAQLAFLVFLARRRGTSVRRSFRLSGESTSARHKAVSVVVTVAALVATSVVMLAWGWATELAGWAPPSRWSGDLTALFGSDALGLVLTLVMVAFLGPFVEELTFRGVVMSAVGQKWGAWAGVVGSSAVFAAFHFSAWQFVPAFALGVALGWLTLKRRSLWPAIALHASYNAVAILAAFWLESIQLA